MFDYCRDAIDAIAVAALTGPFAIYGMGNEGVLTECANRGYFKKLQPDVDFIMINDDPAYVGYMLTVDHVAFATVHNFDHLRSADVKSIIILDDTTPQWTFERIYALRKVPANNIFVHKKTWQNRIFRRDNLINLALKKTGDWGSDQGGLSSVELLTHVIDCLIDIKRRDLPGKILNFGVYKGWSMQFLAEICQQIGLDRKIYGFDTFGGFIQEEETPDNFVQYMKGKWGTATPHADTSVEAVQNKLQAYPNISLIEGDIRKTISQLGEEPVSLALFDMDEYMPTKAALRPTYNVLSPGGYIVHDHFSLPSCEGPGLFGQRVAMLEFLTETPMFNLTGTNVFVKT